MILECSCGRRYRIADGAPAVRRNCPLCGLILRDAATGVAAEDVGVLKEKERALRDTLRQRDRALRQAQARIAALEAELAPLRAASPAPKPDPRVRELEHTLDAARPAPIVSAPVRIDRVAEWKPVELPSDRLDLHLIPLVDEKPASGDLPSDRVALDGAREIPFLP